MHGPAGVRQRCGQWRSTPSHSSTMSTRRSPDEACAEALRQMHARVGGCGGTISIAPSGEVGVAFSTPRMAWACVRGDGDARSGIDRRASLAGAEEEEGSEASVVEVVRLDSGHRWEIC